MKRGCVPIWVVTPASAQRIENSSSLPPAEPFRKALSKWFRKAGRDLPWRRDTSPYAVLVSEFMLQQTQVTTVIPYFERWMRRFPDFAVLAAASEADVLGLWQGLGYYSRARNLQRAAAHVMNEHGGALPARVEAIRALPGVGEYTAGAIASFAFDQVVPTVDGNIARVLTRLVDYREPIDTTKGVRDLRTIATKLLPRQGGRLYTSGLMELGALVCLPRRPKCAECPVESFCQAVDPGALPAKAPRAKIVQLDEPCGWIRNDDAIFLVQQTGRRWKGMWKLPTLNAIPPGAAVLYEATYPFTNHRVKLHVYLGEDKSSDCPGAWIALDRLAEVAITAPHRRAIDALLSGDSTARRE